jgi:CRP-like cAMP-binding protein
LSATLEPGPRPGETVVPRPRGSDTAIRSVRLLDEDPDLAAALPADLLPHARARLVVRVVERKAGAWPFLESHRAEIGLLVLDGVLVREVLIEDTVSAELLGAGDLLRPRPADPPSRLLRSTARWTVLEPTRVAVLGEHCAAAIGAYPGIQSALLDRVSERADRLAITQAICQLNGVDRRVLGLLWHLAERWGRVAAGGVVVPLRLPHRMLASLVGARRPTVTTAIARLTADGRLERRADGTWLLRGEPVGLPTAATSRFVPLRRRTASADGAGHMPVG